MKSIFLVAFLSFFATMAPAHAFNPFSCPKATDLPKGIVFFQPARGRSRMGGDLFFPKRYRQLDGPFMGSSHIDERLNRSTVIRFAGLFTYKAWENGKLIQSEEPQVDLTEFLKFEPGTSHAYETLRVDPRNPARTWRTKGTFHITDAGTFNASGCEYAMVELRLDGNVTDPEGAVRASKWKFLYLPELWLKIHGETHVFGKHIGKVRKRTVLDGAVWPFTSDAAAVLN